MPVVVASFALLLVFLQSTELTHTHADASQQYQCEICVKVGANDDLIASGTVDFSFNLVQQSYLGSALNSIPFLAPARANSRAPPQA